MFCLLASGFRGAHRNEVQGLLAGAESPKNCICVIIIIVVVVFVVDTVSLSALLLTSLVLLLLSSLFHVAFSVVLC